MAAQANLIDFKVWKVPELQQYLKDRGVVYSGYIKEQLVELCTSACRLDLLVDPNFFEHSVVVEVQNKLTQNGIRIKDPKLEPQI